MRITKPFVVIQNGKPIFRLRLHRLAVVAARSRARSSLSPTPTRPGGIIWRAKAPVHESGLRVRRYSDPDPVGRWESALAADPIKRRLSRASSRSNRGRSQGLRRSTQEPGSGTGQGKG